MLNSVSVIRMARRNQLVTLCLFVVCAGAAVLYLTRNGRIEGHSTYIDQGKLVN